jgi:hypothetical protein
MSQTHHVLWVCAGGLMIRQIIAAAGLSVGSSCSHLCSSDPSTETLQGLHCADKCWVVCVSVGRWGGGRTRDRVPHTLHVGV